MIKKPKLKSYGLKYFKVNNIYKNLVKNQENRGPIAQLMQRN